MNDMNRKRFGEMVDEVFEEQLRRTAAAFQYPPTPDVASAVSRSLISQERPAEKYVEHRRRVRMAWALVAILALLAALASVPQVRAAVVEFFQIGAIRLFVGEPTPTAAPTATEAPAVGAAQSSDSDQAGTPPAVMVPATATPVPGMGATVPNLSGETTLEEAEREIGRQLRTPTYPAGIGAPDRVFVQDLGLPIAILVWLEEPQDEVMLSLHVLPSSGGPFGVKSDITVVETSEVNGQEAYWVTGSHFLEYFDSQGRAVFDSIRLVEGNVLIWTEGDLTYRLETDMSLEEAILTAESLR
jgi:hypothetical protein